MSDYRIRFDSYWPRFLTVIALGLILRLTGLGHQSLWLDEMTSIQVAGKPLSQILSGQAFDNHTPPFYYVLLHLWEHVVPLTEFGLRLFSASIDIFNMFLLGLLCRRLTSVRLALLVVSAYAISPFALYYAQEGRMYTLAVFFVLLYTLALERLVNAERRLVLATVMAGIVLALGVYTHYYVIFYALGAISAVLFIVRRSWKRVAGIVSSSLLGVVLFAPWIPIALQLTGSDGQTFRKFFVSVIPYTFFRFVIGYAVFPLNVDTKEYFVSSIFAHIPWLIAVFGTLMLSVLSVLRQVGQRNGIVMIACWIFVVPLTIGCLLSLKVPMLSERYLIVIFPVFLIICLGFHDLTQKRSAIAVSLFYVLLVVGDIAYFSNPNFGKAQWRDAAHYVQENSRKGDVIVFHSGYIFDVFHYYYAGVGECRKSEEVSTNELIKLERLWLVVAHASDGEKYWKSLTQTHRVVVDRLFPLEVGIRVLLLVRS
jgi:uncharacterized membrane protein